MHTMKRDWKIRAILSCPEMSNLRNWDSRAVFQCMDVVFYIPRNNKSMNEWHSLRMKDIFYCFVPSLYCVCRLEANAGFHSCCQTHIFNGFDNDGNPKWLTSFLRIDALWHLLIRGRFNNFCLCGLMLINISCCWLDSVLTLIRTT